MFDPANEPLLQRSRVYALRLAGVPPLQNFENECT
jgi:hypothetical protein